MNEELLQQKVAHLESYNDHLLGELAYIDSLLKDVGFPRGVESIKLAAQELLDEEKLES